MTTTDRPDLLWGYGARMRACRTILGLSAPEFADRFTIRRRTVQRIERGDDPLPAGLWREVRDEADRIIATANTTLDRLGKLGAGRRVRVDLDDQDDVAVAAVAYLLEPDTITPVTAADEEKHHDEIPGQDAGSPPYRSEAGHAQPIQTARA